MDYLERPPLLDDEVVSQYGTTWFRNSPRWEQEQGLSLNRGQLTRVEMAARVHARPVRRSERVRYSTVGRLRAAGFSVCSLPMGDNLDHLLVQYPGVWTEGTCTLFDDCFYEVVEE